MTDEVLTDLTVGSIMALGGGFIAIFPHRFLHPYKGKTVYQSGTATTFMRICGGIVCFGGVQFISRGLWTLWNAGR
jgi:ABC-type xylose transport system permease subunit